MPDKPKHNESQEEYMSRCVESLKAEGKSSGKARDICYAVWLQNKGGKKKRKAKR